MKCKIMILVMSLFAISIFSDCEKKGPAEKAGEQLDKGIDKMHQKAKDAGKDIKESVTKQALLKVHFFTGGFKLCE